MAGRRILSQEQLDQMADLREAGHTLTAIAAHFGQAGIAISASTIAWQCLRLGIFPPSYTMATMGRGCGGRGRPFTAEEDRQLLALSAQNLSHRLIGQQMGRRANSIAARLYTLARHDAIAEDAAIRPRATKAQRRTEALKKHRRKRQLAAARAKVARLERECLHVQ